MCAKEKQKRKNLLNFAKEQMRNENKNGFIINSYEYLHNFRPDRDVLAVAHSGTILC